jgi:hypothetical protein
LLRNTTSTSSISESGAAVRRLRPKSRPFVVAPELAIPIFFGDRFLPMFHFASASTFYLPLSGSFPVETMLRGDRSLMDDIPAKGVISVGPNLLR